jgi:hypothetical protein
MEDKISEEDKRKKDEIGLYRPIKSIMINIEKFTEVFESMKDSIQRQGNILVDIYDIQKNLADLTKDNIDKQRRKEELERVERTLVNGSRNSSNREQIIIPENRNQSAINSGFFSNLMETIGPGLGAFIGASLAGGAAMRFAAAGGAILLKAIPLTLIAPYIGNFITNLSSIALDQIGLGSQLSESQINNFTEALGGAATTGTIGLAFGRRIGALFFTGDLIRRSIDSVFENDSIVQTIANSFGTELSESHVGYIGSALGAGIGLALPVILSKVGWVPILLGGMLLFGDRLREGLTDMLRDVFPNGAESIANFTVDAGTAAMFGLTGMRMGAMFGPQGALVGAVLGLTLGLGNMALNWLSGLRDSQYRAFQEQAQEAERIIARAMEEGRALDEEEANFIRNVQSEAERRVNLNLPEEQIQSALSTIETTSGTFASQPLTAEGGMTESQLQQRITRAARGEDGREALDEIFQYLIDRGNSVENSLELIRGMFITSSVAMNPDLAVNEQTDIVDRLNSLLDEVFSDQIQQINQSNQLRARQAAEIESANQANLENAFLPLSVLPQETVPSSVSPQIILPQENNVASARGIGRGVLSDITWSGPENLSTVDEIERDAISSYLRSIESEISGTREGQNIFSKIYETIRDAAIEFNSAPIIINNTPVTNAPVNNVTGPTNVNNSSSTIVISGSSSGLGRFAN